MILLDRSSEATFRLPAICCNKLLTISSFSRPVAGDSTKAAITSLAVLMLAADSFTTARLTSHVPELPVNAGPALLTKDWSAPPGRIA